MRRKSERNKTASATTTETPEKTRKLTRRGRRSESQAVEDATEKVTSNDDTTVEQQASDRDSSSDREAKEVAATKPRRKISRTSRRNSSEPKEIKPTRSRRRTVVAPVDDINTVIEEEQEAGGGGENGDEINEAKSSQPIETEEDGKTKAVSTVQLREKSKSREPSVDKEDANLTDQKPEPHVAEPAATTIDSGDTAEASNEVKSNSSETTNDANDGEVKATTPEPHERTDETPKKQASPARKSPESARRSSHSSGGRRSRRKSRERRRRNRSYSSSSSASSSGGSNHKDDTKRPSVGRETSPEKRSDTERRQSSEPETPSKRTKRHSSPPPIPNQSPEQKTPEKNPNDSNNHMVVDDPTPDERYVTASAANTLSVTPPHERSPPKSQKENTAPVSAAISPARNDEKTAPKEDHYTPKKQDPIVERKQQDKPKRKRRWLSQKSTEPKPQIIAISTDSLKNLISDVKPVSLADVKLDSSPEPEVVPVDAEDRPTASGHKSSKDKDRHRRRERSGDDKKTANEKVTLAPLEEKTNNIAVNRKISLVNDGPPIKVRPPSPPKNIASNILYITNLVRPFTVLQLKGLLARTGKIVDNGFWIDKIKSKCYVKYETEE